MVIVAQTFAFTNITFTVESKITYFIIIIIITFKIVINFKFDLHLVIEVSIKVLFIN